jgi:hypothetical protein
MPLKLFGEKEVPLPLTCTLFAILAAFLMYMLSKRLGLSERLSRLAAPFTVSKSSLKRKGVDRIAIACSHR